MANIITKLPRIGGALPGGDQAPGEPKVEPENPVRQSGWKRWLAWHRLALGGVLLISIFMNFYRLGQNGFDSYYPAAIRSMMDSWHNFFFVAYDPGGFVTIDKPPVGFWLEVFSAKIFGFSSFSVVLPQALAGVLAVALLYHLVRRHFGVVAGLLAALGLALSPISIVTQRNITIDSTLALVMLLGAWAVMRAAETGRLRWLLLSAAIIGVGFNIKMLEAYLVIPAFGLLYLLAAPKKIRTRIWHLALAAVLLVAISLSWALAVDLTPASQRPWVGSTQNNSEISLALGYNGVQRLLGGGFGGGNRPANGNNSGQQGQPPSGAPGTGQPPAGAPGQGQQFPNGRTGGGPGGLFNIGTAGPLRLFIEPLGEQIVWLLPMALLGMLALAWQGRPRFQSDRKLQSLVLWGTWLLTMAIFFSVAGFFHQYYMTVMAPAIAALFGIGLVTMWQDYRRGGWRGWLLPLALVITIAEQIYLVSNYPTWGQWMIPLMAVLGGLAVVALVVARIVPRFRDSALKNRFLVPALCSGILAMMIIPTVWAGVPVIWGTSTDLLVSGVSDIGAGGGSGGLDRGGSADTALISYLEANQGSAKYLVAVTSSHSADSLILATNKPVMALGGFSGSDPILTTTQLASLVKNGTVRYFLIGSDRGGPNNAQNNTSNADTSTATTTATQNGPGGFGGGPGGNQQSSLTTWVTQNCKAVSTSLWQSSSTSSSAGGGFGGQGSDQLYECASTN